MFHRAQRRPSAMKIALRLAGTAYRAGVLDVSSGGAKVSTAIPLAEGQSLTLETTRQAIRARVIWARDGEAGLRFAQPISPRDVADLAGVRVKAAGGKTGRWIYNPDGAARDPSGL